MAHPKLFLDNMRPNGPIRPVSRNQIGRVVRMARTVFDADDHAAIWALVDQDATALRHLDSVNSSTVRQAFRDRIAAHVKSVIAGERPATEVLRQKEDDLAIEKEVARELIAEQRQQLFGKAQAPAKRLIAQAAAAVKELAINKDSEAADFAEALGVEHVPGEALIVIAAAFHRLDEPSRWMGGPLGVSVPEGPLEHAVAWFAPRDCATAAKPQASQSEPAPDRRTN